jgi:hypothetical protein
MSQENQNVLDVIELSEVEIKDCNRIANAIASSRKAELTRGDFLNEGADKLVELVGAKPDYVFLKQVQAQVIQTLINKPFEFAVDTANTYFGYIIKQAIAKHSFEKPSKDTTDSKRMSDKRQAVQKEFEHISLENITQSLLEINQKMAQDILSNKAPQKDDKALSSKLKMAQDMKLGKVATEQKEKQKSNIDSYKNELDKMLKIDTGRTNKKGNPIFEYSLAKLEFAHYCLKNETMIKKLIADKK